MANPTKGTVACKIRPNVFLARAGQHGEDEFISLAERRSIIGFEDIPELTSARSYDDVYAIVAKARPDMKPRAIGNFAGQLFNFALVMEPGDIVVLPLKGEPRITLGIVQGPYEYYQLAKVGPKRHTRRVDWVLEDVPRSAFGQDLLNSFGAFMTVCRVSRNNAEERMKAILEGKDDPVLSQPGIEKEVIPTDVNTDGIPNLAGAAHNAIVRQIRERFKSHHMTHLVAAILKAEGYYTQEANPGPDGGVDILAGRGSLGLDQPSLCVQVKAWESAADVNVFRSLQGSMTSFRASQGLLVCWGGFTKPAKDEARQHAFNVRLWDQNDLVNAIYRVYNRLPEEIQAELPLKQVWMLVAEDEEA